MTDYLEFYHALESYRMIDPIYYYVLELVEEQIAKSETKDRSLALFCIYFSLLSDGNVCMSLDSKILKEKWAKKVQSTRILLDETADFDKEKFNDMVAYSTSAIANGLNRITEKDLPEIIGEKKIFMVDAGWLYMMKYDIARLSIIDSIKRIFSYEGNASSSFSYKSCVKDDFSLSPGQEKAIVSGVNKNLIITGGPGTGKTTSILFLLLNLLSQKQDYDIYLVAPSGKASSRMKESIINGLENISESYKNAHVDIIATINNLQESTIHRLLGNDRETKGFLFNKEHQFAQNSLFVIDEASMIDICLFDSLLSAIPTGARLFMMGDKNQLPSVECGAVFNDLLRKPELKDNVIELDESIRFGKETKIYELASAINNGEALPVHSSDWRRASQFEIMPEAKQKPIFYFTVEDDKNEREEMETILQRWGGSFVSALQAEASGLSENDLNKLTEVFDHGEESKVLCAENEGARGIKTINDYMIRHFIDKTQSTSVDGYYAGELIMVTKNNRMLDLYNGDCGLLVTFENDPTLYYMVKKASQIVEKEGKEKDKIFKLGSFVFYPFRMITQKEIDFAYAITIHKSQGSDYKNILVILPRKKGHPLVNRQIVYTAITRTKGNTYIVASQEILEEARDTLIVRDTNVA